MRSVVLVRPRQESYRRAFSPKSLVGLPFCLFVYFSALLLYPVRCPPVGSSLRFVFLRGKSVVFFFFCPLGNIVLPPHRTYYRPAKERASRFSVPSLALKFVHSSNVAVFSLTQAKHHFFGPTRIHTSFLLCLQGLAAACPTRGGFLVPVDVHLPHRRGIAVLRRSEGVAPGRGGHVPQGTPFGGAGVCVCVFLCSVDRANRLANEKTSIIAGEKKCLCVSVCVFCVV